MKALNCSRPLVLGLLASLVAAAALAQGAPRGNEENGRALYERTGCWQCHGWAGQGGAAGPKLNPPLAYEPYFLQLRQPRFVMIPYSAEVLSDQEAADIYAYISTFPPPPDPASIPLLQ